MNRLQESLKWICLLLHVNKYVLQLFDIFCSKQEKPKPKPKPAATKKESSSEEVMIWPPHF